ncbi:MAG: tRNA pseudouridine(55) synthase TruB [Eubacteriales bacterium]|jgi:tRNA pseudouridine55 synthase
MAEFDINGIIIINKNAGVTSHTALNMTRQLFDCQKAGHCGTLDPNARGVLPVMLGNAVKASEFLTEHNKSYVAELILGIKTDSGDITGNVIEKSTLPLPSFEEIKKAVKSFEGGYDQIPPMYSALKVNGKKLVDIARKGQEVERNPRRVDIYSIDLNENEGKLFVSVDCSRGTYIRTLCEDIGNVLGIPACMGDLLRTRVGNFSLENAVTVDELAGMTPDERKAFIIPVDKALDGFEKAEIKGFFATLVKNGLAVETRKLGLDFPEGSILRLYENGIFFAVGEIIKIDDKLCLKHKKIFV